MREAVVVEAVRTPVGRRGGGLAGVHPVELGAQVLRGLQQRTGIDPALIEDVIWGCVTTIGEQSSNIGRWSALIGLVALLVAMGLGHVIRGYLVADPLGRVFEEGLIILGWVANWRPAQIFLYDWWPLKRRCRLYRRLAAADIALIER